MKSKRRRQFGPDGMPVSSSLMSVGDILKSMVKKSPLGLKMRQALIWEDWEQIAGPTLAPHGRPHGIKKKTLEIEVDSSVWMNRYAYYKWDIIKRINSRFRRELISDIFILLTPDGK
jgi:predicted nucleic acid-binding Zn ribbon protein